MYSFVYRGLQGQFQPAKPLILYEGYTLGSKYTRQQYKYYTESNHSQLQILLVILFKCVRRKKKKQRKTVPFRIGFVTVQPINKTVQVRRGSSAFERSKTEIGPLIVYWSIGLATKWFVKDHSKTVLSFRLYAYTDKHIELILDLLATSAPSDKQRNTS